MTTATAPKTSAPAPGDPDARELLRQAAADRDETAAQLARARGAIKAAAQLAGAHEIKDQWGEAETIRREQLPPLSKEVKRLEAELKAREEALLSAEASARDAGLRRYKLVALELVRAAEKYEQALRAERDFWQQGGGGLGGKFIRNESVQPHPRHLHELGGHACWLDLARRRVEKLFGAAE
jgi:hypothetical protein